MVTKEPEKQKANGHASNNKKQKLLKANGQTMQGKNNLKKGKTGVKTLGVYPIAPLFVVCVFIYIVNSLWQEPFFSCICKLYIFGQYINNTNIEITEGSEYCKTFSWQNVMLLVWRKLFFSMHMYLLLKRSRYA